MKGYLIKPAEQSITEIGLLDCSDTEDNSRRLLQQLYEHLLIDKGSRLVQQMHLRFCVRPQHLPMPDVMLVDEEGLIRVTTQALGWFCFGHQSFAGRGIVLGETQDGWWTSPKLTIEQLRPFVRYSPPRHNS